MGEVSGDSVILGWPLDLRLGVVHVEVVTPGDSGDAADDMEVDGNEGDVDKSNFWYRFWLFRSSSWIFGYDVTALSPLNKLL